MRHTKRYIKGCVTSEQNNAAHTHPEKLRLSPDLPCSRYSLNSQQKMNNYTSVILWEPSDIYYYQVSLALAKSKCDIWKLVTAVIIENKTFICPASTPQSSHNKCIRAYCLSRMCCHNCKENQTAVAENAKC